MSFPTKEQALAVAFSTADVGDEVVEHAATCTLDLDDDGECSCPFIVWKLTRHGWLPA